MNNIIESGKYHDYPPVSSPDYGEQASRGREHVGDEFFEQIESIGLWTVLCDQDQLN